MKEQCYFCTYPLDNPGACTYYLRNIFDDITAVVSACYRCRNVKEEERQKNLAKGYIKPEGYISPQDFMKNNPAVRFDIPERPITQEPEQSKKKKRKKQLQLSIF